MKKSKSSSQGIQSSQRREVGNRLGASREGILPAYPGTLGNMRGNHATETGRTRSDNNIPRLDGKTGISVELGNTVALNSGSAPGQGRTIMKSGSQMQTGAGAGPPAPTGGRDILSEFGPESLRIKR
jgi:hypothetical protein